MAGNPCNVATGNKYQTEVDFVGTGPFPLLFERHYNSDLGTPRTRMGKQWRHTYDRRIVFSTHADIRYHHSGALQAFVHRPDGKIVAFVVNGSTAVARDADTTATLRQTDDYQWVYEADDIKETYRIRSEQNGIESFARLEKLEAPGGFTQALEYYTNNQYVNDRLRRVTDHFGRTLDFSYSGGRIAKLTDPDGNETKYTYTSGRLTEVTYPDTTPGDATDNPIRQYIYGDASNAGALTQIVNEKSDVHGTWAYDSSRRAISSENLTQEEYQEFCEDMAVASTGGVLATALFLMGPKEVAQTVVEEATGLPLDVVPDLKDAAQALGKRGADRARQLGERARASDNASEQFESIERAQREARQRGEGHRIESIEKSRQREKHQLDRIDLDDLDSWDD